MLTEKQGIFCERFDKCSGAQSQPQLTTIATATDKMTEAMSSSISEKPAQPLAHQAIHDTVVAILEKFPRGRLIDVPAGHGALAERLIAEGFEVCCCDLYPEIFRLENVEIRQGDLNRELPFDNGSFDYTVCVEGLEHIENPQQAMREFARVLRPGGQLIVSVPNILNIEERLKWLIYGYTSHFKPITREQAARLRAEYGDCEEIAAHVNPIGYSELRYLLEKQGFEIVRVHRDKRKARTWLYWPIVALIRLIARLTPKGKRSERWTEELVSDEILLGGNTLIVHAVLD
jgi:SAM-dependent methyltransferase